MSQFARTRALLSRRALGMRGPVGPVAAAWALHGWLGSLLEIQTGAAGSIPLYCSRRDGGARITLPATTDERQEALWLLEEASHFLCRGGYAERPFVNPGRDTRQALTLDELREQDEEGEAIVFADTLQLPDADLEQIRADRDAWELVWEHGFDEELFSRRRQQVNRGGVSLRTPPPWCAWLRHSLELVEAPILPRVRINARDRAVPPVEIPIERRDLDWMLGQIHADLAALMPHEFRLKYAPEQTRPGVPISLHWEEFLALPHRPRR